MGGARVASANNISGVGYNPAAISFTKEVICTFHIETILLIYQ